MGGPPPKPQNNQTYPPNIPIFPIMLLTYELSTSYDLSLGKACTRWRKKVPLCFTLNGSVSYKQRVLGAANLSTAVDKLVLGSRFKDLRRIHHSTAYEAHFNGQAQTNIVTFGGKRGKQVHLGYSIQKSSN